MAPDPFFSLVVPAYNRADLIGKTLKSLQQQEYPHYEIIIVDDGSTDNTEEVVQPFLNDKTRYYKKNNAERAAARNYGARIAQGDYVNFFDSDDIALPNHLTEAANLLKRTPSPEWFHLAYAWSTPEGNIFRNVNQFEGNTLNDILPNGNVLSCNGVFVRKDIILQFPFNEDRALSASEDFELWLRLAARFPLPYSNEITSLVIDHEGRSVRKINGQKLIDRLHLLIHYLQQDEKVQSYFGQSFQRTKMDALSYIALHLADQPSYKSKSVKYLFKAYRESSSLLRTKRFYATIKNLMTKW
ncbi:glycosyltransferase family 2 protein [Chitinophagaceae bacterium MMS25-I14]